MSASREKKKRREEAVLDTSKNKNKGLSDKSKSTIKYIASVVIILAVVLVIVVNSGVIQQNAVAATVGSEKITVPVYNYYYYDTFNSVYNSLGDYAQYFIDTSISLKEQQYYADSTITWDDYIAEEALKNAQQVAILTSAAKEAGYVLTDENNETISNTLANIETYASYYSVKPAEYLANNYGSGASLDSYKEYLTQNVLAGSYSSYLIDNMNYSDDEINTYYNENSDDFDTVSYRSYYVAAEQVSTGELDEDGNELTTSDMNSAQAKAEQMAVSSMGNEQNFIDTAYENASDDNKETYSDPDYTLSANKSYSSINTTFTAWLFDHSRYPGETTTIESGNGYYVLYFAGRNAEDYNVVNVRHILVIPEADEDAEEATEEQWAAALELANQYYLEWQDGDRTEDSFAELANEYSDDGGSNTNGGLYEGVYKGQMVQPFENWCFDPSRQVGDTGIVETSYGYHIMYYSGTGFLYREAKVIDTLRSDEYSAWLEARTASFPFAEKYGMRFTNR